MEEKALVKSKKKARAKPKTLSLKERAKLSLARGGRALGKTKKPLAYGVVGILLGAAGTWAVMHYAGKCGEPT